MRVDISTEVHGLTQPNAEPPAPTWNITDSICSSVNEVVAAFLRGLADDFDPPTTPNTRTTPAIGNARTRIQIWENPIGKDEILLTDLITKKPATIGATLRGTAESIMPVKKHMRD